ARRVWSRWGPPGWTLRRRLVTLLVASLTGGSLTIGVISTIALQHYLLGQLDDKVAGAAHRTAGMYTRLQGGSDVSPFSPGQPDGTIQAVLVDGKLADDVRVL